MKAACFALAAAVALAAFAPAKAQDTLKIAVPQRGAWDTSVAEIGNKAGNYTIELKKYDDSTAAAAASCSSATRRCPQCH